MHPAFTGPVAELKELVRLILAEKNYDILAA